MAGLKIMVTGASGFLGTHLVQALLKQDQGHQVFVLARTPSSYSHFEPSIQSHVQIRSGDITLRESLCKAFQGMDLVFHLAAMISYKKKDNALMEKVNVQGTENVLEACVQLGIPELVYVSSVSAIGASRSKKTLNEESPFELEPLRLGYFNTKHEAEKKVFQYNKEKKIKAYIANPSTIYGAGDARKGSRRFQLKVAKGQFPFYPSGGVNVVHVEDVVKGLLSLRQKGRPGERYILAGENLLIKDLFALIAEQAGVRAPFLPLSPWTMKAIIGLSKGLEFLGLDFLDSSSFYPPLLFHWFDAQKAQKALGIEFQKAKVALGASIGWIKEQGLL